MLVGIFFENFYLNHKKIVNAMIRKSQKTLVYEFEKFQKNYIV